MVDDARKALATAKAATGAKGALDALTDEQRATIAWAQQNGVPGVQAGDGRG
jgi:hypothetical protein